MKKLTKSLLLLLSVLLLVMGVAGCGGGDDKEDPIFKELTISEDGTTLTLTFRKEQETLKEDLVVLRTIKNEAGEVLGTEEEELSVTAVQAEDYKSATIAVPAIEKIEAKQIVTYKVTYDGKNRDAETEVRGLTDEEKAFIAAVAAIDDVTLDSEDAIAAAEALYAALDAESKAIKLVDDANDDLVAARAAVDALDADVKALVDNVDVLEAAEAAIAAIEADMAAAAAVDALIAALPAADAITADDEAAIVAAEAALAALTEAQLAYVTMADTLTAARAAFDGLVSYISVLTTNYETVIVVDLFDLLITVDAAVDKLEITDANQAYEYTFAASETVVELKDVKVPAGQQQLTFVLTLEDGSTVTKVITLNRAGSTTLDDEQLAAAVTLKGEVAGFTKIYEFAITTAIGNLTEVKVKVGDAVLGSIAINGMTGTANVPLPYTTTQVELVAYAGNQIVGFKTITIQ